MAIIEGTRALKVWRGNYSFAVDGGATGTITLRSPDGPIPNGSVITGGYIDVTTACTSGGAATIAAQAESAGDVLAATAVGSFTVGRLDIIPDSTGSTALKTTASRNPAIVIGTAALTAGVFDVVLLYR